MVIRNLTQNLELNGKVVEVAGPGKTEGRIATRMIGGEKVVSLKKENIYHLLSVE